MSQVYEEINFQIMSQDIGVTTEISNLNELRCSQKYKNISFVGKFCEAAWDGLLCWSPTVPSNTVFLPCPQFDSYGNIIGESSDPEMYALRICQKNGDWLDNKTNFSRCLSHIEELFESSLIPTVVAYILIIGSILSLLTLSVTLFIFCYFKCLHCSRLKVHRNLCVALMMNLILLIISSSPILFQDYRNTEWMCKSVLCLQMYSALASTNWMFVEGLLLHSRVTVQIFRQDAPFKLYYCIGWGLPAVLIGSWAFTMSKVITTECWNGYGDTPYIWIITGPMMAALLINTVFLINIIRVLMTRHHANVNVETTQIRKAIKATALLFPLLGLTHLLFCINPKDEGTLEAAYMIINASIRSSQGLFVGVLYCFMNTDVQTALRNAYLRSAIRRNPNHRYNRGRGMSQTSATYVSHTDGVLLDTQRQKSLPRAAIRLQEHHQYSSERCCLGMIGIKAGDKTKMECSSTMF